MTKMLKRSAVRGCIARMEEHAHRDLKQAVADGNAIWERACRAKIAALASVWSEIDARCEVKETSDD